MRSYFVKESRVDVGITDRKCSWDDMISVNEKLLFPTTLMFCTKTDGSRCRCLSDVFAEATPGVVNGPMSKVTETPNELLLA